MFRSAPPRPLVSKVPARAGVWMVLILGLALLGTLVHQLYTEEREVMSLLTDQGKAAPAVAEAIAEARWRFVGAAGAFFLFGTAAVVLLIVLYNQKVTALALEDVKGLARDVLQNIPTGVITLDRAGIITSVNRAAGRLLPLPMQDAVGRPFPEGLGSYAKLVELIGASLGTGASGRPLDVRLPEAKPPVVLRVAVHKLIDHTNDWSGSLVLLRDLSELTALEEHLRRSDRLAALGTLTAGVAHEIKNPLSALQLNLQLLYDTAVRDGRVSPDLDRYHEVVRAELQRLKDIVEKFLNFSRPSRLTLAPVDLNRLVASTLDLVSEEAAGRKVHLYFSAQRPPAVIMGDPGPLNQALLNIILNGVQAMPKGGRLRIDMESSGSNGKPAGSVALRIADTGEGIPPAHLHRIFDPYFTTRERGTGLGLFIAHKIIEEHRGAIQVASAPGEGTTFLISFPLAVGQV